MAGSAVRVGEQLVKCLAASGIKKKDKSCLVNCAQILFQSRWGSVFVSEIGDSVRVDGLREVGSSVSSRSKGRCREVTLAKYLV